MWKTKYFIKINEEPHGSYSVDELQSLWDAGTINSDTLVALDGKEPMLFWNPLRSIKTLKAEEVSPPNLALKNDTKTTCSKCGGDMTIPNELAGQIVSCPHCGDSICSPRKKRQVTRLFEWFKFKPTPEEVEYSIKKHFIVRHPVWASLFFILFVFSAIIHGKYFPDTNIYSFLLSICISLLVIGIGLVIYFFPVYMAIQRKHKNIAAIFALNLLTGWTFIGWVISLVWALKVD